MSEENKNPSVTEKLKVDYIKSAINQSPNKLKASNQKSTNKVHVTASIVCRICHTNTVNECLISPCNCKGTLAYVHLSCLERWLNQSSRSYCELCMFRYSAIETKRYKLWQGLKMWIRHPMNRVHVRSDLLIGVLLTLVTSGLIACSVGGLEYFIIEGTKLGVQKKWIKAAICLFLITVIAGYVITMFLIIKDQFVPWYRWWTNTVDIRLLLPNTINNTLNKKQETINVLFS